MEYLQEVSFILSKFVSANNGKVTFRLFPTGFDKLVQDPFGRSRHQTCDIFELQQLERKFAIVFSDSSFKPQKWVMVEDSKMKRSMLFVLALAATALSGCVNPTDTVSRSTANGVGEIGPSGGAQPPAQQGPLVLRAKYLVQSVQVIVPRDLVVSEANTYLPSADLVWRGDVRGDRYVQIQSIFEQAAADSILKMSKGTAVSVELEVVRFHCLTEKTRYTIGGVHSMAFMMTVRDAATNAVLEAPRLIIADVKAAGGSQAIAEDEAGRTQKVVVTERLAQVLRRELSAPVPAAEAPALALAQIN